jgi:chitinase
MDQILRSTARRSFFILMIAIYSNTSLGWQTGKPPAVIAYYAGRPTTIDSFDVSKISHLIFSFCHLKGNRLNVSNARDTLTIQNLIAQKKRNPQLKVLLSLGGWGGCKDCSTVFGNRQDRKEFIRSVKELLDFFRADGIDLDWEYPAIEGFPGHLYSPEDKHNFTLLIKGLRRKLGKDKLISFAAGGFTTYLENSIEWKKVMKRVDFVNLMTYDFVGGDSRKTGHHTALYSTSQQQESADHAVSYLISIGVPPGKMALGAAFYGRSYDSVSNINNGLFQSGKFRAYLPSRIFNDSLNESGGFVYYWDDSAKAPYCYNSNTGIFATFENPRSVSLKAKYVVDKKLFGIMFWQLTEDHFSEGLLDAIDKELKGNR